MDNIFTYIAIVGMMVLLPGADTILLIKNTISHGTKAGLYTMMGMATGTSFWTLIAVLGLSMLIAQSVVLFSIIKYLGAAYLIYLGIKSFFAKSSLPLEQTQEIPVTSLTAPSNENNKSSFMQAFLSNILNPKAVLVYITIMPQFINLNGNVNQQLIILGSIATLLAVAWFLILIFLMDYAKKWFESSKFLKAFQKSTGVILVAFGVRTAF